MNHPLRLILCAAIILCGGCRRTLETPQLRESAVIGAFGSTNVVLETWRANTPMSQPIWRVCLRPARSTNSETLFTVVKVFQESEPGLPLFETNAGAPTIQDAGRTYVFDLGQKNFLTNGFPGDVHPGEFQPKR